MTPNFALSLSFEGIALLRRMGDHWARIEEVPLDSSDLESAVISLRNKAESLDPDGAKVALLIPNEQIRYLSFADPGGDDVTRDVAARAALDGATPYDVRDLSFDISLHQGEVKVAAVAHETLQEAEEFAKAHGFVPVCHVAQGQDGAFAGPAFFGKAKGWRRTVSRLSQDITIRAADEAALTPVAALLPDPEPEKAHEPALTAEPEPELIPETPAMSEPQPPESKPAADATTQPGGTEVETGADTPQMALNLEDPVATQAATAKDAEAEQSVSRRERRRRRKQKREDADSTAEQIQDTNQPVLEPNAGPPEDPKMPTLQTVPHPEPESTAAPKKSAEPPQPEAEPPAAPPKPARAKAAAPARVEPKLAPPAPASAGESGDRQAPPPLSKPAAAALTASAAFSSMRVRADRTPGDLPAPPTPKLDGPSLTAQVSPRFTPVGSRKEASGDTSGAQPATDTPAAQKVPEKARGTGNLLGGLRQKIKRSGAQDKTSKMRAALSQAVNEVRQERAASKSGKEGEPATKGAVIAPADASALTKTAAESLRQPTPEPAAPETAKPVKALKRRRAKAKEDARTEAQKARDAEAERLTVFGQRSSQQRVGGKPRFLGLILTSILLLFLIAVAAWATVFMEDGIASLFGRKDTAEIAATEGTAPLTGQTAVETDPDAGEEVLLAALESEPVAPPPALPEPPQDPVQALTREEAAATYAATGIWQRAPNPPLLTRPAAIEDPYIASIDPTVRQYDAVALPNPKRVIWDATPHDPGLPPSADRTFDFDDRGLIRATPEGALTPDGVRIFTGKPPVVPPLRGVVTLPEPETPAPSDTETNALAPSNPLAQFRPEQRPSDLIEQRERANLGGISLQELAKLRPLIRPKTAQETAAAEAPDAPATAQAVRDSLAPVGRPRNIAAIVSLTEKRRAQQEAQPTRTASVAAVAPRTVRPSGSVGAGVARNATVKNAINLSKVSLIGVYGTPSNRRALVRLPSGQYKKVKSGDRLDGGRVQRIDEGALRYSKGGRSITLKMPRG